jgi:hypothetical protein
VRDSSFSVILLAFPAIGGPEKCPPKPFGGVVRPGENPGIALDVAPDCGEADPSPVLATACAEGHSCASSFQRSSRCGHECGGSFASKPQGANVRPHPGPT